MNKTILKTGFTKARSVDAILDRKKYGDFICESESQGSILTNYSGEVQCSLSSAPPPPDISGILL